MNQGGYPQQFHQQIQLQYAQYPQQQHQLLVQQQQQHQQQTMPQVMGYPQNQNIASSPVPEDSKNKKTLAARLEELKNVPNEKQIYVFGMDIPQTGITNLNQEGQIHQTFGSPFAENPNIKTDALNYQIPQSYSKPQVQLNPALIKKFPDDTLFYIFYNNPDENQQFVAVQVLYERGWKYNHCHLTWMKEIEEIGQNTYNFQYLNIKEWKILKSENVKMNLKEELVSVADFQNSLTTTDQTKSSSN